MFTIKLLSAVRSIGVICLVTVLAFPVATSAQTGSPLCNSIFDIVLIMDRSASMDGQKLNDAKKASKDFIDLLNPTFHNVSLVSFSNYASIESDLTNNYASVKSAVDSVNAFGNTYIDDAINSAHYYLSWRGNSDKYIILMSDGLPSGGTENLVRQEVIDAKNDGIKFFTVGLGDDVDGILMKEIASNPSMYYRPLNSESLGAVYQHIAADLCCGNGIQEEILSEECDDGNQQDGDGCDAACDLEYVDIGMRIFDGNEIVPIAVIPPGMAQFSPLRISKGGEVYGIGLVSINHGAACNSRIRTSNGIRALRKLNFEISSWDPLFFGF